MGEERHPDVNAVPGLPEVGGPWIGVDLRSDLINARERMHDDRVLGKEIKRLAVDRVDASSFQVLG